MKKIIVAALIVTMMGTMIAGCGSNSNSNAESSSSEKTEEAGTEKEETAEASKDNPAIELRIAHQSAENEGVYLGFEKFKEEIEAADVGITVTIFPAGQLVASDRDSIEAVTLGEIDMTSVADVQMGSTVPAFYLFNAEFLFDSIDDAYDTFFNGGLYDGLADATASATAGCELAGIWSNGGRALWTTGLPVRSVADFKGANLRCAENEISIAEMEALGAVPVTMAWNEIYTGLQQGTVKGLFSTKNAIVAQGFTAVLDYCIDTNHSFGHAVELINTNTLNKFTDEQKAAYEAAMKAATEYEWELAKETEADLDDTIETEVEYIHLTDEEREEISSVMVDATEPLVKEMLGDDADLLELVRSN